MISTVTVRWLTGLRSCEPASALIFGRRPLIGDVVEFCIGIPEDQYLRKGCDRWLIRRAMKGRLPDVVLYKKKYGLQAADWYPRLTRERDHIAEKVKHLAANDDVASIFDLQRVDCDLGRLARAPTCQNLVRRRVICWRFRKPLERHISSRM